MKTENKLKEIKTNFLHMGFIFASLSNIVPFTTDRNYL